MLGPHQYALASTGLHDNLIEELSLLRRFDIEGLSQNVHKVYEVYRNMIRILYISVQSDLLTHLNSLDS